MMIIMKQLLNNIWDYLNNRFRRKASYWKKIKTDKTGDSDTRKCTRIPEW